MEVLVFRTQDSVCSLHLFPRGSNGPAGCAEKEVLLPGLLKERSGCPPGPGALLAQLPDVEPVLATPSARAGWLRGHTPVCAPAAAYVGLISHQDCRHLRVPRDPCLSGILLSAVYYAHAFACSIHSCIYWWLPCTRPCFQR